MFQQLPNIQERFPYPSLGIPNSDCEKSACYRIHSADTLKHMNDSWKRLIETKRFKSGVAGFLRTTK